MCFVQTELAPFQVHLSTQTSYNPRMMKNNTTTSGWSNFETWALVLRYEECFLSMADEQEYDDVEQMADSFQSLVNELEFDSLRENSLAHEAVGTFLDRVDWEEIAEHFFKEKREETEDDETADLRELKELIAELE